MLIATVALAAAAGFVLGRFFTMRVVGGCVIFVLGLLVLGTIAAYLLRGEVRWVYEMTRNLAFYITYNFAAFVAFVIGGALGLRTASRGR